MANRCLICDKKKQVGVSSRHHRGVAGKQWMKRAQKTKEPSAPIYNGQRLTASESGSAPNA